MLVGYCVVTIGAALKDSPVWSEFEPAAAVKIAQTIGSSTASVFMAHQFSDQITGNIYAGPYPQDYKEKPAFIRAADFASWPLLASGKILRAEST